MTATCRSVSLPLEQRQSLGIPAAFSSRYMLTQGRVYVVLGVSLHIGSPVFGSSPTFEVVDDGGRLVSAPAALFSVCDGRVSQFWKAREVAGGFGLTLWPEEFYREYFHDDLSEGVPETKVLFEKVVVELENEAKAPAE